MVWEAEVRMHGMPIRGSDRFLDGQGALRWKLFGLIPVMMAAGADITRSVAGRVAAESVWLPSALYGEEVSWEAHDPSHPRATIASPGETAVLSLTIDDGGRVKDIKLPRRGNPDGAGFRYVDFGGVVEDEDTFGGYTIPIRLRDRMVLRVRIGTIRRESSSESRSMMRHTGEQA